jgi:hypothetical protein
MKPDKRSYPGRSNTSSTEIFVNTVRQSSKMVTTRPLSAYELWQLENFSKLIREEQEPEDPHADWDRTLD